MATLPQDQEPTVTTTVAAPESVWKAMKMLATDRRVSSQSLWIQAAREFIARESKVKAAH